MVRVYVGKRGVIVIPKAIREKLGIEEGMTLEMRIEGEKLVLRVRDLWSELRDRGRRLEVNLEEAEEEIDRGEDEWMKRLSWQ